METDKSWKLQPPAKSFPDRFLSIFYPPAIYEKANITVAAGKEKFFTYVKVLKEPGFLEIAGQDRQKAADAEEDSKDEDEISDNQSLLNLIMNFRKGDIVNIDGYKIKEGKTSPPKRYTSGSMILAMENAGQLIEDEELRAQIKGAGIGTSATRAGIIEKLVKVGYLGLNKKTQVLTPKEMGELVYEVIFMTLPGMLEPKMTASWEKGLSGVENGDITPEEYRDTLEKYVRRYVELIKADDLSSRVNVKVREIVKTVHKADRG